MRSEGKEKDKMERGRPRYRHDDRKSLVNNKEEKKIRFRNSS